MFFLVAFPQVAIGRGVLFLNIQTPSFKKRKKKQGETDSFQLSMSLLPGVECQVTCREFSIAIIGSLTGSPYSLVTWTSSKAECCGVGCYLPLRTHPPLRALGIPDFVLNFTTVTEVISSKSVVKSTCSWRAPSITPVPREAMPSSDFGHQNIVVHRYTCRQNTHSQNKNTSSNRHRRTRQRNFPTSRVSTMLYRSEPWSTILSNCQGPIHY